MGIRPIKSNQKSLILHYNIYSGKGYSETKPVLCEQNVIFDPITGILSITLPITFN